MKQGQVVFVVTPRRATGKEYLFAVANAESRQKWITAILSAAYSSMYVRTREAVRFLERCKEATCPFYALVRKDSVSPLRCIYRLLCSAADGGHPHPGAGAGGGGGGQPRQSADQPIFQ
jgi:hypothetical protein